MRLALAGCLLSLLATGCTRSLPIGNSDGGQPDLGGPCSARGAADCGADGRCVLYGCCGGTACFPVGTPPPECPVCPACAGLSESACNANPACRADYCLECSCTPTFVGCALSTAPKTACPGLGCDPACGCNALDEKGCIAAESSLGCTPFYCPDCHGGQSFVSCLAPNQGAGACGGACPAGCRSMSDCTGGQECVAPGASPGCGVCMVGTDCATDAQCPSGQVCDTAPCVCTNSGRTCIAGCKSSAECGEGQSCTTTHHCAPTPCTGVAQCPTNFTCLFTPAGGQCTRRACTSDADCAGAWCVDGACYGSLGMCTYPPA
jgi:Cys-rich repeat protein